MDPLKEPQKTILPSFKLLPEVIQTWLTSPEATGIVMSINEKFDIFDSKGVRIIPSYITRLVIKMIKPENFISELKAALKFPEGEIKQIAAEIKGRILRPIALGLKNTQGIDIDLIPVAETKPAPSVTNNAAPATLPRSDDGREFVANKQKEVLTMGDVTKPVIQTPRAEPAGQASSVKGQLLGGGSRPFMLHEEKPIAPLPSQKESFSFHVESQPGPIPARPAPARFASPFEEAATKKAEPLRRSPTVPQSGPEIPRVVHYTAFKTTIGADGKVIANNANENQKKADVPIKLPAPPEEKLLQ